MFVIEYIARLWIVGDMHHTIIESGSICRSGCAPRDAGSFTGQMGLCDQSARDHRSARHSAQLQTDAFTAVFLLFRLFKLFRYSRSVHGMTGCCRNAFEFYNLAFFMIFVVICQLHLCLRRCHAWQHHQQLFDALYWAMVTLSTVGYGDITPHTPGRQGRYLALIVSGIRVLAFSTSIVVAAFQDKLSELREHRVISNSNEDHCSPSSAALARSGRWWRPSLLKAGSDS